MKRQIKQIGTCLMAGVFFISKVGLIAFAQGGDNPNIHREERVYTSTDVNHKEHFPSLLEKETGKFHLKETSYEILSSEALEQEDVVEHKVVFDNLYAPQEAKVESTLILDKNGETLPLKLKEVVVEEITISNRKEVVKGTADFELKTTVPEPAKTKRFPYLDKQTGETVPTELQLKELVEVTPFHWKDDVKIPVKVHIYDSEFYKLQDKFVPYNPLKPEFKGYEKELLESLSLDTNSYKIEDFSWTGETYLEQGVTYRNAEVVGQRYVANFRAEYESLVDLSDTKGYQSTANYVRTEANKTGERVYTIKAIGRYERENINTIVLISLFLFIVIVFVLIVLFKLKEKEKRRE